MIDNRGMTALMCMTGHFCSFLDIALPGKDAVNRGSVFQYILEYLGDNLSDSDFRDSLLKRNNQGQNIFHLAAISAYADPLVGSLRDYIDVAGVENILVPDIYNNTPLMYFATRYSTVAFSEFMMKMPPWEREQHLVKENMKGISCKSILINGTFGCEHYLEEILGFPLNQNRGLNHAALTFYIRKHKYDTDMLRIIKYSLNEYSPLDLCIRIPSLRSTHYNQLSATLPQEVKFIYK